MADYIYTSEGRPQGFRLSNHIYTLDGTPVGRVFAEKAYCLDGTYVGMIVNNMVVDRSDVSRRSLPPSLSPPRAAPPSGGETRRPIGEAFPDAFGLLVAAGVGNEPLSQASLWPHEAAV
jgi:hypothetical protein